MTTTTTRAFTVKPVEPSAQLQSLLTVCGLPAADIHAGAGLQFYGMAFGGELIGVVGLENCNRAALLRSLAVSPAYRDHGLGKALVKHAEQQARVQGIVTLCLLTTSAAPFFSGLGYKPAQRAEAPEVIRSTTQFASLCPADATFMVKQLSA